MTISTMIRASKLTNIFLREQLREPVSLLWTLISPSALFYFIIYSNAPLNNRCDEYLQATAGFYAYIACTVAFFGVAFHIVGRRESGFIRSFIYSKKTKTLFLVSHLACYLATAALYCCAFYIITKPSFGNYSLSELGSLLCRFLTCFIAFCSPALLIANGRLKFQTANTVISAFIFIIITTALLLANTTNPAMKAVNTINPFMISKTIMSSGFDSVFTVSFFMLALAFTVAFTSKTLRINPVWSRY